jgi:formylglycine-generating enzyme required for sulfatase activity
MRLMKAPHAGALAALAALALLAGCGDRGDAGADGATGARQDPSVTISGADAIVVPAWQPPPVEVAVDAVDATLAEAEAALRAGRLFGGDRDALPLLLALRRIAPGDARIANAVDRAVAALVAEGDAAIAGFDADGGALRRAHEVASVARTTAPDDARVRAFLSRVDRLDEVVQVNHRGERELRAGRLGEGETRGALGYFREALRRRPGDARANQGLAAVESALIRRAEQAAGDGDFDAAERWLGAAARVRPSMPTVADARARVAAVRRLRVGELRDRGIDALRRPGGLPQARRVLSDLLRIAEPGDPAAAELRERIDQVAHYGLFRPGQVFTDALRSGARGPQLVVVPHGAFRMGAAADEADSADSEKPAHYVRFDRGFAMSRTEVTVGQFRRFVEATGYRSRAVRRGHSTVYDERGGNFVRRSGVDWRSDYAGAPAGEDMPVLHVSARDAEAYVEWLAQQSGERYRLPSEAEFEYALRAGTSGPFAWNTRVPPRSAGNVTGSGDQSPGGRRWRNAFAGYGDGWWGPAPVASFVPNAFGLHDLAGNVSEWVADCWHAGYRRAPANGEPWVNPGCRTRVMRGGAWSSAPAQVRSAWRLSLDGDTTNARLGFRVVREL